MTDVNPKKFLAGALGSKTPKAFHLYIPSAAVRSTRALTSSGAALELADATSARPPLFAGRPQTS